MNAKRIRNLCIKKGYKKQIKDIELLIKSRALLGYNGITVHKYYGAHENTKEIVRIVKNHFDKKGFEVIVKDDMDTVDIYIGW